MHKIGLVFQSARAIVYGFLARRKFWRKLCSRLPADLSLTESHLTMMHSAASPMIWSAAPQTRTTRHISKATLPHVSSAPQNLKYTGRPPPPKQREAKSEAGCDKVKPNACSLAKLAEVPVHITSVYVYVYIYILIHIGGYLYAYIYIYVEKCICADGYSKKDPLCQHEGTKSSVSMSASHPASHLISRRVPPTRSLSPWSVMTPIQGLFVCGVAALDARNELRHTAACVNPCGKRSSVAPGFCVGLRGA